MPTEPSKTDALYSQPGQPAEARVTDLLSHMTLAEKIGQMMQVENNSLAPDDVADYHIGSVLSGGGGNPTPNTPVSWASMVRGYQEPALRTRLRIPLLYGVDAVHGHNNMHGAVIFPHNIGLGATRDEDLVERVGQATATEVLATGVHWTFAPTVAVPQDIRWGRTYEGYSQDTELVSRLAAACVRGLQNANGVPALSDSRTILATPKHFVGDGGTAWGTYQNYPWIIEQWPESDWDWSIDQGVTQADEAELRASHLPPYVAAIEAGARCIMVSFSSWGGFKMHAQHYLLTEVLKGELGFDGFLVSDWMAIDQLNPDYYTAAVTSINAGLDMIMVPFNFKRAIDTLTQAVERGDIPLERIDDAVRRILRVKFELGLFEHPFGDESLLPTVGSEDHRAVAREAVRKSLVLLKNDDGVLPLPADNPLIYVAGAAADDVGLACGGWTIEWQGGPGDVTLGTTLVQGLRQAVSEPARVRYDAEGEFAGTHDAMADVGIVVLSEMPYAEGEGDHENLRLPESDVALLKRVRGRCKKLILILYSGRPLIITPQLELCDALVAAWLPGSEAGSIADVLVGDYPFTGVLPFAWPRSMASVPGGDDLLFPLGYGLTTDASS